MSLKVQDSKIENSIRSSSKYLMAHFEGKAINQEIGAISALFHSNKVLNDTTITNHLKKRLSSLEGFFSQEGWFYEYGGFDLGYLSVSLSHLSQIHEIYPDDKIVSWIFKCHDFMEKFILPSHKLGGAFSSRNTEYFLLDSFAYMATKFSHPSSVRLLATQCDDMNSFESTFSALDDRYLLHYIYWTTVRALNIVRDCKAELSFAPIDECPSRLFFKEAGVLIHENESYKAIVNFRKNGVVVWEDKIEKKSKFDFGYSFIKGNNVLTTNWLLSNDVEPNVSYDDEFIVVEGHFYRIKYLIPTFLKHFLLRIIAGVFKDSIIQFLKRRIIFQNNVTDFKFKRKIAFERTQIRIEDKLPENISARAVKSSYQSPRHVASSCFYSTFENYQGD